jgi:hypothetical protein
MLAITLGFVFHSIAGGSLSYCKDSTLFHPNRPFQNEYQKRAIQVRNAPVFAPVFTALRRGELLRRGKECGERPHLISVIAKHRSPCPVK